MADESGQGTPEPPLPASGLICQNCGVTVAAGYPKCPKCHGPMPRVTSPLAARGPTGGTSAESDSGGLGLWLALLLVAAATGAVIYFATRSDSGDESPDEIADFAGDAGGEEELDAGLDDAVEEPFEDGDAGETITPEEAIDALEQALSERRFYSGIEVEPDDESSLRIESAHCDDAAMRGLVDAAVEDLGAAGFARVGCYSRHGTRAFEIDLLGQPDEE